MNPDVIPEKPVSSDEIYEKHDSAMDFLAKLAAEEFDVHFSKATLSNWKEAHRLIYRIDNIFDGDDASAKEGAIHELRSIFDLGGHAGGLDAETRNQAHKLRSQITSTQAQNFVSKGLQVISIGETMRNIQSPREVARLTKLEGQLQTTMHVHLIDEKDLDQENMPDFIRFLRVASRVANVVDSVADLKTDYHFGITQVKPSLSSRIQMMWEVLPDIKKSVSALGMLAVLRKMPKATIKIIGDRNRAPEHANID